MEVRDNTTETGIDQRRYLRIGWALLLGAVLAVAVSVLATAAQPHVLWLFSMSNGAVAMVVGLTLIRIGQHPQRVFGDCPVMRLDRCRS
jgi:hypothetical protein